MTVQQWTSRAISFLPISFLVSHSRSDAASHVSLKRVVVAHGDKNNWHWPFRCLYQVTSWCSKLGVMETTSDQYYTFCEPGSSVVIATDYGLDGPGSNPSGDEIFRPSRPALGPTQPPVQWVPGLSPGVKCGRGVLLTTHPLLVPRSWKSTAIPLPTVRATPGL